MMKKCSKCGGTIDLESDGYASCGTSYRHSPKCPPASAQVLAFPRIQICDKAEDALELAKGWNFTQVMIVGYVEGCGTPEGTIIHSVAPDVLKTAKNQLFMAELLRYQALKATGLL